jgi:hypothetical protein
MHETEVSRLVRERDRASGTGESRHAAQRARNAQESATTEKSSGVGRIMTIGDGSTPGFPG